MEKLSYQKAYDAILAGQHFRNGLRAAGYLYFIRDENVKHLPDPLVIEANLSIFECPMVTALPDELHVGGTLSIDGCVIRPELISLPANLPDTVLAAMVGKRVGDVMHHPWLEGRPIMDLIITNAYQALFDLVFIHTEGRPIDHIALPPAYMRDDLDDAPVDFDDQSWRDLTEDDIVAIRRAA